MKVLSCTQIIRSRFDQLTAAERKIAEYCLSHQGEIHQMSIGELADCAGVAKSAVVRCCQSLGFDGYPQFKLAWAAELSKNKQLNYVPYILPENDTETIIETVFSANVKALHDTVSQLQYPQIEELLDCLCSARQINLFGVGTSASLVTELQYRLMQLGYNAYAYTDPGTMKISTMNMGQEDVAFAISYSGRTVATVEAMALARESGVKTACITSFPESPLSRLCDYPICIYTDEVQYPVEAMSAKIAHLSLIYALTTALSAKTYNQTMIRAKRTRELIDSIRMRHAE